MKSKKFKLLAAVITSFSIFAAACSSSSSNTDSQNGGEKEGNTAKEETVTLKVATYFANTSQTYKFVTEPWMDKVTELTEGKVQFDVYPGEQLGKAHDMINLTKDGVTDISVYPANYFADTMPLSNTLAGMPELSINSDQGTKAYYDLVQQNETVLETDFLKNGVRPLTFNVSPTYEIWTTGKEIRVPSDLKGLKVRTPGGVANEFYEYMGVVPVATSHSEVYEALEKGVIEALSGSSVSVDSNGTTELLKYAVTPHIGTAINCLVINEKVWQGLSEDVQKAMIEAGEEIAQQAVKYDEDTETINKEFIETEGVFAELTEEEQAEWKKVSEEFTQTWLKEHQSDGHPYEEVMNMYKENLEKYKQ